MRNKSDKCRTICSGRAPAFALACLLSLALESAESFQQENFAPTQANAIASQNDRPQDATRAANASSSAANPTGPVESAQQFKLSCQPGEQRQFSYESSTKVWGSTDQQVRLRATLQLRCMEPPTNTTLKYLAEIVALTPDYLHRNEPINQRGQEAGGSGRKLSKLRSRPAELSARGEPALSFDQATLDAAAQRARAKPLLAGDARTSSSDDDENPAQQRRRKWASSAAQRESEVDQVLRAEPLLEEVGDAASRMGRSLSGWFSKAWLSVKDFFGNIFTSNERSLVSRDQAFKESGLDIMGQCRAGGGGGSSKHKNPAGLPFDESVFEDLGPEYYIGASLDGSQAAGGGGGGSTTFEFAETSESEEQKSAGEAGGGTRRGKPDDIDQDEDDLNLSFFNDPTPLRSARAKRSSSSWSGPAADRKRSSLSQDSSRTDLSHVIRIPFVFVQSRTGKIVEIRFGQDESDLSVKNFKRHLCDLFATNLDWTKTSQNEVTPIGKHQTKYQLDSSPNSIEQIKASALKSSTSKLGVGNGGADEEERSNKQQLVRVLAAIGTGERNLLAGDATTNGTETIELEDEERDPSGGRHDDSAGANSTSVSVLRSINTTSSIHMSSKMLTPDIDRIHVRVQQVQQINEGRLVGTAGQLSMTLVQQQQQQQQSRTKRASGSADEQVEDISDLLRLSTSFSMQLVPVTPEADHPSASGGGSRQRRASAEPSSDKETKRAKRLKRAPLVTRPPADQQELQRVLQEWRKQEARLQLSASNLVTEDNGQRESQQTRLDILRDQIRQRLNEEFVRNRIRRALGQQVAQVTTSSRSNSDEGQGEARLPVTKQRSGAQGDIGLGLSQLVLGSGVTSKRKGSVYATIEEVLELEAKLAEDFEESAISSLLRDTVKMGQLRQHCKSAIPTLDALSRESGSRLASSAAVQRRAPFGVPGEEPDQGGGGKQEIDGAASPSAAADIKSTDSSQRRLTNYSIRAFEKRNDKKLEQCQRALQLMLRLNDRQAIELVLDLIDECNQRLVAAAKREELGYGPTSKFYRRLRQRLVEMLNHITRPSEALLSKLIARLHYPNLNNNSNSDTTPKHQHRSYSHRGSTSTSAPETEFVYVGQQKSGSKYNKSLLQDEDDFNNNDAAALLVMTITSLAARNSIGRPKRVEVAEKLLLTLRGTSCSLFNTPDLDIIESMSNFQEPLDEIVGRISLLARKCKHQDQYLVACVHGLSGQLQHAGTQRLFVDLLKSQNSSCLVKSEIVLTLVGAQLNNDLKQLTSAGAGGVESEQQQQQQQQQHSRNQWLNSAASSNRIDETLLELMRTNDRQREPDRRCLKALVAHYMSKKWSLSPPAQADSARQDRRSARGAGERGKRAILNEQNFWDEAQCRRWSIPADGQVDLNSVLGIGNISSDARPSHYPPNGLDTNKTSDLIDEIDDLSIVNALVNSRSGRTAAPRNGRRHQRLIERELESSGQPQGTATNTAAGNKTTANSFLRRRHKCVASKDFGPKNAQANLRAEIVNDLVGSADENKFLARFRLGANFLGNRIDVGRMYLWHQRRTTRAYANILGRSIWDSSHGCKDKAPNQVLYMPLFDFNLWLVKVSVGLRLNAEMGFYPNCDQPSSVATPTTTTSGQSPARLQLQSPGNPSDDLQLFPTVSLRAAGEATAKLVIARAGMSVASQYSYQGDIRVSRQPESCMSVYSSHQPMNVTFSSWFQLWDNDCHFWGSRGRAEPQAIKWRLTGRKPIAWLEDECLAAGPGTGKHSSESQSGSNAGLPKASIGSEAKLDKIDP